MIARITPAGEVIFPAAAETESQGTEAQADEAHNPILAEMSEVFYATLAFAILFILMWKFAFPAVKKGMDARTQRIRNDLDEAEQTKAEASRILDDYQRQLADARSESGRIIEEARQTAEQMRHELIARAEADVAELRQRSVADIDAAKTRALADLRGQVSELAIQAAELVVQKNLDRDTNRTLVDNFINQVGATR